ncbi:serine hydrolase [Thiocystis violacea]|uniref:serine hydrolase n=1 Tax=Thiocystis violacea TaxID=13725 RepID=UPI0019044F32|nr:serine hydrolase [Thiocystis violacea]MBK1722256.1 serine hydrolase [Thiocystis violacea]
MLGIDAIGQNEAPYGLSTPDNEETIIRPAGPLLDPPALEHDEDGFFLSRRQFLEALAATSAGLMAGAPSYATAASSETSLGRKVNDLVKRLRRQGLILPSEKTSWSVFDFTTGTKLVSINEAVPRQAAKSRKVRYTGEVKRIMERMIQKSSNPSTNRLIDLVSRNRSGRGARDVEAVLKQHAPGVFEQTRIVEKIPRGGSTYANKASAHDYSRFLYALKNGTLPYSSELRRIMRLPNHDRIVHGVSSVPDSVRVCDKTGSTARLCGNMGIIEARDWRGRSHAYTMIGIIERRSSARNYGRWITKRSNAIRKVSNLVYLEMKDRHGLV